MIKCCQNLRNHVQFYRKSTFLWIAGENFDRKLCTHVVSLASYSVCNCKCNTSSSTQPYLTLTSGHSNRGNTITRLTQTRTGLQRRCFASRTKSRTHYYDELGLSPKASQAEVKSAYYRLSKLHHPDISKRKGASKRFTDISEAYEVLGNTKKRKTYDQEIVTRGNQSTDDTGSDYTKPFREREGFGTYRKAPPTGRTKQFNFDEFYRQHYSESFQGEKAERQRYQQMQREMEQDRVQQKNRTIATVFMILCFCMTLLVFRTPAHKNPNTKKD